MPGQESETGHAAFLPGQPVFRSSLPNGQLLKLNAGENMARLVAGDGHGDRCNTGCLVQVDRDEHRALLIVLKLPGRDPAASVIDVDRPHSEFRKISFTLHVNRPGTVRKAARLFLVGRAGILCAPVSAVTKSMTAELTGVSISFIMEITQIKKTQKGKE